MKRRWDGSDRKNVKKQVIKKKTKITKELNQLCHSSQAYWSPLSMVIFYYVCKWKLPEPHTRVRASAHVKNSTKTANVCIT
jgi:hypothetical protein